MKNPIACRLSSYGEFQDVAFEHLASLGVRHVELVVPPPAELPRVQRALAAHGLSASSLHGPCDVVRADVVDQVTSQLPAFQALDCRVYFASAKAGAEPLDRVHDRLRHIGDALAPHGIVLALETHPDLMTNADTALRTLRAVGHPNVRVNFDTANLYFYNHDIDAAAELRKLVHHVAAVHLKDTDGGYRHWHFPALGRGVVPFAEVFALLREHDFAGPLTLEIEGVEGETRTRALVQKRIAESVEFLRRHGWVT